MREPLELVVIGNGMVGARFLTELVEQTADAPESRMRITVVGGERQRAYDRIALSNVLAGKADASAIELCPPGFYEQHGITLRLGVRATGIGRGRRRVYLEDGSELPYDRLVLATGSRAITLDIPGATLPGVHVLRTLDDLSAIERATQTARRAVVIGGGLLGLEAAHGLRGRGLDVAVVHVMPSLMERQLDAASASLLCDRLGDVGLRFLLSRQTRAILGDDRVRGVLLDDGSEEPADLVVMAIGVRPDIELAKRAELPCDRGVLVNDVMQTNDPRIYAIGECAQHRGRTYGIVAPLYEQARVCANQLAEDGYYRYRGSVLATHLKVTGVHVFSIGEIAGADDEVIVYSDPRGGRQRRVVVRGGVVVGAVLYGDTGDAAFYSELVRTRRALSSLDRAWIALGPRFAPAEAA